MKSGLIFLFSILLFSSQTKAQEPIKTLPKNATEAYKSVLAKFGLTVSLPNNATWVKENNSSDIVEYDIILTKATTLPFKAIFVVRYFEDKSGEHQIEVQLRFKMSELKNTAFKGFSEAAFKTTLQKCKPENYAPTDLTTIKFNFDYQNGALSNLNCKAAYYLISQKKSIDEDCEKDTLDEDDLEELKAISNILK